MVGGCRGARGALLFVSVLAVVLVAGWPAAASAQTVTGTIQGTITDTSGAVLPGVTLTIRHVETGAVREIVSNEAGIYSAPYVAIGRYTVTATLAGFGTVVRENIQVGLNDTRVVDIRLDPRITDTVTVTAEVPPINVARAEVKSSLTSEQIMDRPVANAGSFLDLANIFPGFQDNPTSGQNNPTSSSGSSINFNNSGTRGTSFQINGVNNDDSSENQNRQGVALSTIAEFQVLKNGYSAEFGRGDGAVVLVQTKSGTNQVRGDAYLYMQDNKWNARSFFAVPGSAKAVQQRKQYGFTSGFPVMRDRLFSFVNVDRTQLDGEGTLTRDLPLPSEIGVPWLTRGNDTPANRAWIQSILDRFPSSISPNDPRSPRTWSGLNFRDWPDEDYSGRFDLNVSKNQTVTGRYQYTHQIRETEDVIIGEQAKQDNEQQNLGITYTHVVNSRIVGEARYGLGLRSTNVNIGAGNDTPVVRFSGLPVTGAGPIIGNAGAFPINRDQTDHQMVYNLSMNLFSNHQFKMGTDIRRQQLDDFADNFSRGFWSFGTSCGGTTYANGYLAMLDGCISSYQKAYGPLFLENRMNEANFYAQDDWRLHDSLTLNLGLRYEYVEAPREAQDRIDYIFGADKNNVEPRIGAAWVPGWTDGFLGKLAGGERNLVFQGAFGIYDGRIFQSVFSQSGASVRFNPPNAILRGFTTAPGIFNIADPTNGFVFVPGTPTARVNITLPDENLEMPSTRKWTISAERVMPWNSSLKVSYIGTYANKRLRFENANLPLSPLDGPVTVVDHPFNAPAAGFPDLRGKVIDRIAADVRCAGTGFFPNINVNAACPVPVPLADNEISLRVPRTNERRPDPRYGGNIVIRNSAEAWYDGLEIVWEKRLSQGLQFQASYTRSKSMDTNSEATFVGPGDTNFTGTNVQYAKGYSRFHTPHRFTLSGSYHLPFFGERRDLVGQALGGWILSGVLRLASGTPFTVTSSSLDLDFNGFNESRPVLLDPSVLGAKVDDRDTSRDVLKASAFRNVTFGDTFDMIVPRNAFFGDGLHSADLALAKVFRMPFNNQTLGVRIEAFNAFNWVQFGFPVTDVNNANFGAITGTATGYSPRVVQLTFRYRY